MQLFATIYQAVMQFSRRREAPYYLSLLSFVESFILPFPPPDVMLAPMALAKPSRAMHFARSRCCSRCLAGWSVT